MIKKVENCRHLHDEFIKLLICGNQIKEAAYWCKVLDYDNDQLKPEWKALLGDFLNGDACQITTKKIDSPQSTSKIYHSLKLDSDRIVFVDCVKMFEEMCSHLSKHVS